MRRRKSIPQIASLPQEALELAPDVWARTGAPTAQVALSAPANKTSPKSARLPSPKIARPVGQTGLRPQESGNAPAEIPRPENPARVCLELTEYTSLKS